MSSFKTSASSTTVRDRSTLPFLLAASAGFVDTCTFLAFGGFFVAQATGSFVTAGSAFWPQSSFDVIKIAAIPVFIVAGMATTLLVRRVGNNNGSWRAALLVEALLVAGLMVLGFLSTTLPTETWACLSGLAAMGVQGAICRLMLTSYGSTNVMTTNTVQLSIELMDCILNKKFDPRVARSCTVLGGFLGGVAIGALAFQTVGFACLAVPIFGLVASALLAIQPRDKIPIR